MGSSHASTIKEELRSILKGVFNGIRVEVLVNKWLTIGINSVMSTAQRLCIHRPCILHPAKVVNMVNIKVVEASATGPQEAVEPPNLIFKVAHVIWLGCRLKRSGRTVHSVNPHKNDFSQFTVSNSIMQLLQTDHMS